MFEMTARVMFLLAIPTRDPRNGLLFIYACLWGVTLIYTEDGSNPKQPVSGISTWSWPMLTVFCVDRATSKESFSFHREDSSFVFFG